MKSIKADKTYLGKFPKNPGTYVFKNEAGNPIYVGKAKNLSLRVRSYFTGNLERKTKLMVEEAKTISYIKVRSELEAILLEANLVKEYSPKFNSQLKDDKSPLYIGITKEKYPRVITLRKTALSKEELAHYFGPFTEGRTARRVLRFIRKIFPYSQHKLGSRPCTYSQIGLCNPCPSFIEKQDEGTRKILRKKYLSNINSIKKTLRGELDKVTKELEKAMHDLSKAEQFEEASLYKRKISMLNYITQSKIPPALYVSNPNLLEDIRNNELASLKNLISSYFEIKELGRIECYDVAHLSGTNPTASMITFIEGDPDKNFYRHFRIRGDKKQSDTAMMREVLQRRKKYFLKWGIPDLIIVDGGKPQVGIATDVIDEVPLLGLAKRYETLVVKTSSGYDEIRVPKGPALNLLQRIRNEAHRFARRYHHTLVARTIRQAEENNKKE